MNKKNKAVSRAKEHKLKTEAVPFWNRFSTLLNLSNFGIFSVLLVIVILFAFQSGKQTIEQYVDNHLISTNLNKINQFNQWLRNNEESMQIAAERPGIRANVNELLDCMKNGEVCTELEKDLVENRLQPMTAADYDFLALSVLRASDGLIIASTETSIVGKYKENELFFLEGKSRTYSENAQYSLTEGETVMHVGSPIYAQNGRVVAVLAAHVNVDHMKDIIQQRSGLLASEETYLVSSFNYFVTEPFLSEENPLRKTIYTDGVQACLAGNTSTSLYDDYRGIPVIGAYNWLPDQELCILTETDAEEAYAPINALRFRLIAIGLSLFAVSVLIGYILSLLIVKPIAKLAEGVKQIGAGNLTARVDVKTKNEFRLLADSFNGMAGNLEGSLAENVILFKELEKFNKELEERVEQRTAQLKSARDATLNIMKDLKKEAVSRKRAQKALTKQAADLERSNKDLQQFAYVASHDLQEPLRMVASYLQLLVRRYADRLDGDALEFINFAVDGSERMKVLINDLLDYSRVGTRGKEFEPTDLNQVLGKVRVNLTPLIEEKSALVANDELPIILADQSQMMQLFQNLIANALKFHGDQKPQVHLSVEKDHRNWVFRMADNGIGIDPQYFERIFVIFQRLHSKSEYTGTGIGLAVSKRIVERHGGSIWVESQPGNGSVFYFTLPIYDPKKETKKE